MSPINFVHEEAVVDTSVKLGPFTTIFEDVIIGANTVIGPNVTIYPGTRIGENCKIFPGAVIGAIPQDMKFADEYTTVEIGNNTTIRECVTINRATSANKVTKIGNDCLLMAYSHVAHDCTIGNHCIIANSCSLAGHVILNDFVVLEGLVAIQQFVEIGEHAFIAGASLVRKNVPPFVKAAREPLSYIGVNTIGLNRRGFDNDQIRLIEDTYRILFIHNQNVSNGVQQIEKEIPDSEFKNSILNFIEGSHKGIIKGIL